MSMLCKFMNCLVSLWWNTTHSGRFISSFFMPLKVFLTSPCLQVCNRPISVRHFLNVVSLTQIWLSLVRYREDLKFTHSKLYVSLSICFSNSRSIISLSVSRICQYFRIVSFSSSISGARAIICIKTFWSDSMLLMNRLVLIVFCHWMGVKLNGCKN